MIIHLLDWCHFSKTHEIRNTLKKILEWHSQTENKDHTCIADDHINVTKLVRHDLGSRFIALLIGCNKGHDGQFAGMVGFDFLERRRVRWRTCPGKDMSVFGAREEFFDKSETNATVSTSNEVDSCGRHEEDKVLVGGFVKRQKSIFGDFIYTAIRQSER
jgi:hypothetical protein